MRHISSLEYLSMSKPRRAWYKFYSFILGIPFAVGRFFRNIPRAIWKLLKRIGAWFSTLWDAFRYGNWKTRLSVLIWGFGCFAYRQIGHGILYLGYEILFVLYMVFFGAGYLGKFGTLGTVVPERDEGGRIIVGDNSFEILLYSMLTLVIILFTVVIMLKSVKEAYGNQLSYSVAQRMATAKDDVKQLLNHKFHLTILAFPSLTLVVFTIVPLLFMILVAFTNYNRNTLPPAHLFTWVGFDNFASVLTGQALGGTAQDAGKWSYTFWHILGWTLEWAVIATVSNLFLGMILALIINKKSIKLKKFWRTCLVTVIAVPQFISLLLVSKMFRDEGIVNTLFRYVGLSPVKWLTSTTQLAKIVIIVVNIWVGVPYTVLTCTGILMNIPGDLYEAARIDGANPVKMFSKITLPYMMFVLGPSLITTFVGNINNFNIIFLLTGGQSGTMNSQLAMSAGDVDLLITWLYKLTVDSSQYDMASVLGILIFVVVAFFSLFVYSRIGSVKNEEDFQ
ncbi:MAG: sugar ABC transporter permease [Corallococcus sp.]|nr:sugar ABC transporter permease [Bacillota bacterium]MCM1533040.1 sugar ABC transporter permease [Corallococcus sp.]